MIAPGDDVLDLTAMVEPDRGHVIVIGNEKGGAGKSTVAMHLSVALLLMGAKVAALDLDTRQRTLSRYLDNREASRGERSGLVLPHRIDVAPSRLRDLDAAEADEAQRFESALEAAVRRYEFVVIDSPGSDTFLSRLAHARADTLITPLNDSFVDFALLADMDPETGAILKPSVYSEMVWEARKRKAAACRRPMDWLVMRNRIAASRIEAKNKQRVGEALKALSQRIGFRIAPGFAERVIYRELFPQGLTLLDLGGKPGSGLTLAQVAARQEVRDLVIVLKLPGLDGRPLAF